MLNRADAADLTVKALIVKYEPFFNLLDACIAAACRDGKTRLCIILSNNFVRFTLENGSVIFAPVAAVQCVLRQNGYFVHTATVPLAEGMGQELQIRWINATLSEL